MSNPFRFPYPKSNLFYLSQNHILSPSSHLRVNMSDVKELLDKIYATLIDLMSKLSIRKLSEGELEIYGEYEYLTRLYEILRQLGIEVHFEKEYVDGFKTYYLRVILH